MRRDSSQNEVGWLYYTSVSVEEASIKVDPYPLSNNVAHRPCHDDIVVLILVKVEVFFHSRDKSIGNIRGIDLWNGSQTLACKRYIRLFTHLINIPSVPNVKSVRSNYKEGRLLEQGTFDSR